uniref:Ig-like domain-containing protein n=1 Tax=Echeneis naucrates TaxID=173247 RepID=A0A665WCU2_ECHNA
DDLITFNLLCINVYTIFLTSDVTLTCNYHNNMSNPGSLYWIRHVPGNLPEVLGATYTFGGLNINNTPRFIATIGSGTYVLRISNTQLSDTAFYYCEIVLELQKTYGNFTFLRVTEVSLSTITAVTQEPPYDLVRPGDSVTFQCLVLSDSEKGACSEDHHVYWLRVSSAESHPAIIHVNANADQCDKQSVSPSTKSCIYKFSMNLSSSDAGIYYCAVVSCGEILFGNGTKVDIGVHQFYQDVPNELTAQCILCLRLLCFVFCLK